jgi:hypothetical protein
VGHATSVDGDKNAPGGKSKKNRRGVYNLEFVVHIVAFGFFPAVCFHRCSILLVSSGTVAVGPAEAAVPRDLFLPHSATSYLSLFFSARS